MTQIFSALAASLVLASGLVSGDESYDEPLVASDAFQQAWNDLDWDGAFAVIKPSEHSDNAHPVDLMFLAGMYLDEETPNLGTARERALKFWELSERAALTGYEAAVIELANALRWGDETLGYESDAELADCLDRISEIRAYVSPDKEWLDQRMVRECLLQSNSPAVGNYTQPDESQ